MQCLALIPVAAPLGVAASPAAPATDAVAALLAEPALVELALLVLVGGVLGLVWTRLSRQVEAFRGRSGIRNYLLGVELAAAGHPAAARKRLQKVLAQDPENHHARLLLGEVLAELGATGEAHKHHVFLQRSFGVRSVRNDLALARLLLSVGRAAEAVEAAQRAVEQQENRTTLHALWSAQRAAGLPEAAGRTGIRLLRLLPDGDARDRLRRDVAAALALAGAVKLRSGDLEGARASSKDADAYDRDGPDATRLRGQIAAATGGVPVALAWAAESSPRRPGSPHALPAAVAALSALVPTAPYRCTGCGAARRHADLVCEVCGAEAPALSREPALFEPLESASAAMDEVEANRAHVQRQIRRAAEGDEQAVDDLVTIGEPAVEEVLLAASRRAEGGDVFVSLMHRMGPRVLPALLRAYATLKDRPTGDADYAGDRGLVEREAGVLGRVVQGYGRDALPWFEELLDSEDRDVRKVLLDFYLGLGEPAELARVLEHVPPIELLHRLNAAPEPVVVTLLRKAVRGDVLVDGLLLEPAFQRERELLLAVADADDPDALVEVLERRGPSAPLIDRLVRHLAQPPLGQVAGRLLDVFAASAMAQMLSAFADLDRPSAARRELRRRLIALGPEVVVPACRLFGPAPAALDADVIDLLVAVGDDAVAPLKAAYVEGGPMERRLRHGGRHRRGCIVGVLGSLTAGEALRDLRDRESDPASKLRIVQALQGLATAADTAVAKREEERGQTG